jgi:hypothetical protein
MPIEEVLGLIASAGAREGSARQAAARALAGVGAASEEEIGRLLRELHDLLPDHVDESLRDSPSRLGETRPRGAPHEALLGELFDQLWARYRASPATLARRASEGGIDEQRVAQIVNLYGQLGRASGVRHLLLRVLAGNGGEAALRAFVETILADPPGDARQCDLAFVPLFQQDRLPVEVLFPRLLEGIEHPALAVQVLDLANHVTRRGMADKHPAAGRLPELLTLYSGLVNNLQSLEQKPAEFAADAGRLRQMVSGCVELLVSLSHALALIGDQRAVGKLRQALELSHRRLRAEAAAALAQLGDEEGTKALVRLAAEPNVRRRAIAYLEELGKLDDVPEEFRTEVALAEAELAAWLAEPAQLSLPPHVIAKLDSRRLRWPGYDEPVDCYLFRYEYQFPRGVLRGVGIAGPLLGALATDVSHLPPEDIYAIYAGRDAEHGQMSETKAESFSSDQTEQAEAARRDLEEIGYEEVRVLKLGEFFGDTAAVASAQLAGDEGLVISAGDHVQWFPGQAAQPNLGADEVYWLFKGRALLSAFNPPESTKDAEARAPRPR